MRVQPIEGGGKRYTPWIRWRGNLIPIALAVPFLALSALHHFLWLIPAIFACRIGMNRLGLTGNDQLRTQGVGFWVGIQTRKHRDPIEPHYDVGLLRYDKKGFHFKGDRLEIQGAWRDVKSIERRANPHSWVGLGGWLSVETENDRLDIESRHFNVLSKNKELLPEIEKELRLAWKQAS